MPIIHNASGSTTLTGDAIDYYRLCVMKGAVGLECKGMKARRGPVVWKQAAREFQIKGNKQAVYDWLCREVERQQAKQEHISEEAGRTVREVEGKEVN